MTFPSRYRNYKIGHMRYYFLTLAFLFLFNLSFAQKLEKFVVYFDIDKYEIRSDAHAELKKLNDLYQTNYIHQIKLSAHTDSDADDHYNIKLSKNRALVVENYLIDNKIKKSKILKDWSGEYKPIVDNSNATNKQKNRRVEIEVIYEPFTDASQVLEMISKDPEEFVLTNNETTKIAAKNGSIITIPSDAFVDKNGNPIPNTGVTFFVKESLTMGSAVIDQLTTHTSDGEVLESGGMIQLQASLNYEEVKIVPGVQLDLQLATNNGNLDRMEVFEGTSNSNGLQIWTPTNRSFIPTPFDLGEPLRLPENIFEKYENLPLPSYNKENLIKNPNIPKNPGKLSKPSESRYPQLFTAETVPLNIFEKILGSRYKIHKIEKLNNIKLDRYERSYANYEKRLDSYYNRLVKYENNVALFKEDVDKYHLEIHQIIDDLTTNFNEIKMYYDKVRLRVGINRIKTASANDEIFTTNLQQITAARTSFRAVMEASQLLYDIANKIYIMECMNFVGPNNARKYINSNGDLNSPKLIHFINYQRKLGVKGVPYPRSSSFIERNLFAESMTKDVDVQKAFEASVAEKRERDEAVGYDSQMKQSYKAGVINLGWVNCDRLSKVRFTKNISFAAASGIIGERIIVVIHKLKSILQPTYEKKKYSANMALSEKSTAVNIAPMDGKVMLSMVEFDPRKTDEVEPDYKEVSLAELEEELSKL
jgi:hypothetical protein